MFSRIFFPFVALFPSAALAFTIITANMKGWDKDEIKFYFNPESCSVSSGRIEESIENAVNLWNGVPSSRLRVEYGGQTAAIGQASDPVISCVTTGISGAVGVGSIVTSGGVIQTGEIQLNSEPGDVGDIARTSDAQLDIALAHEMGHIFGLGHSTTESSLMYYSLGKKEHLTLSQDDMDGITWLYPRDEPRDGFLGCGSLGGGGASPSAPILLAMAVAGWATLLLRRRGQALPAGWR